jgi:CheY-like chemotaxis protein
MRRTILVADESPTIRRIVELTFGDDDVRVESVASGREALERIAALRPDVVLVDVALHEPSGYELCRAVKESPRPVPVLLLSGAFDPFDRERAEASGADGHLVKPFESGALRSRVTELLRAAAPPGPSGPGIAPRRPPAGDRAGDGPPGARRDPSRRAEAPALPPPEWLDAVAREIVARLGADVVREVAREIVPALAREMIRERIRELERGADDD